MTVIHIWAATSCRNEFLLHNMVKPMHIYFIQVNVISLVAVNANPGKTSVSYAKYLMICKDWFRIVPHVLSFYLN
jgi:hypothetical protein